MKEEISGKGRRGERVGGWGGGHGRDEGGGGVGGKRVGRKLQLSHCFRIVVQVL